MKKEEYLRCVTDQIRCKKACPGIEKELEDHITDQAEMYLKKGMTEEQALKKAIAENIEQFGIYPDAMCVNLRNAIAEKERVGVDNVLCSNGAAEMIFAVVRAVMPKKTLLLAPTFSEYERTLKSVGSQICYYYLKEENDFDFLKPGNRSAR